MSHSDEQPTIVAPLPSPGKLTVVLDDKFDLDTTDRERMTQRDQVGGALGGHDPSYSGNRERVSLGNTLTPEQLDDCRAELHPTACRGSSRGDLLGSDVDHARRAGVIDVSESLAH